MKLKYKKMVIIASIVVMALGFVALVFLDNGSPNQNAQTADLNLNENKDIKITLMLKSPSIWTL